MQTLASCRCYLGPRVECLPSLPSLRPPVVPARFKPGWNDVSWHNERMESPILEQLAKEGVILDQHYALPTCTPTRAALMTGRYPYKLGIQSHGIRTLEPNGLPLGVTTLAEELKRTGYTTHAFGKWHLGYCNQSLTPTRRGFDTFRGFYVGGQDYFSHTLSGGKTSATAKGYDYRNGDEVDYSAKGVYTTTLIANHVLSAIEESQPDKPMFLYVAFQAVHAPLQVPTQYRKMCSIYRNPKRKLLCEMLAVMDHAVGLIVKKLKMKDMWRNTLLVFISDNGGQILYGGNNWPLRGNKNTLFEGGTRVPAFVAGPLIRNGGRNSSSIIHVVDWFPTLLSAAGGESAESQLKDMDGVDQWAAIRDGTLDGTRTEFVYNLDCKKGKLVGAIRDGDLKFILKPSQVRTGWYEEELKGSENPEKLGRNPARMLFNISADPLEKDDLFASLKTEAQRLEAKLRKRALLLVSSRNPDDDPRGDPSFQTPSGTYGPGWCDAPEWTPPGTVLKRVRNDCEASGL
uniref:Sulfatase N-terminal domain-containing protein n=1 Tax=Amblyomma maculatum TaxID=34609 RepID=G3MQW0_AMBMU